VPATSTDRRNRQPTGSSNARLAPSDSVSSGPTLLARLGHLYPIPAPDLATPEAERAILRIEAAQRVSNRRIEALGRAVTPRTHGVLDHRPEDAHAVSEIDDEAVD
jgi:hypothetical protein